MDPLPPRKALEKEEEDQLRRYMTALGWHVEKTHGNLYMKGWPDLYAMHPGGVVTGKGTTLRAPLTRWIEVKRKDEGALEGTQMKKFTIWQKHGVNVWILTGVDDYTKLFGPPNWMWWLDSKLKKLT